jgi:hypothetical protein
VQFFILPVPFPHVPLSSTTLQRDPCLQADLVASSVALAATLVVPLSFGPIG